MLSALHSGYLVMNQYFRTRGTCRLCDSPAVEVAIPLQPIPAVTPNMDVNAVSQQHGNVEQVSVPLDLYLCRHCGHLQILDVINPDIQYTHFKYTTSISLGLPEHFRKLADELITSITPKSGGLVIEIGSNDGTLLRAFKERKLNVLGIDPARDIALRATDAGIPTIADFFTSRLAEDIATKHGCADILIANNTFANIDDLGDVAAGIKRLLAPHGVFVFETSYGADVVDKFLLDTVYHEHLSYFMVRSLIGFFRRHDLELYDVQHIWTKGGSLRGFAKHAQDARPVMPSVAAMAERERSLGLDHLGPYRRFAEHVEKNRAELGKIVDEHRRTGQTVAGYGASVGTVTLVQQFGLGSALDFIVDDNPLADAIIGPGHRIPIVPPAVLDERKPPLTIVLAWRYAASIKEKNASYIRNGGQFLVPLPEVKFV
jgi:SAM-dependent methyltransferase